MGFLADLFRKNKKDDDDDLEELLKQAEFLMAYGGHQSQATDLLKKAERICRKTGNKEGLETALRNQALLLKGRREIDMLKQQYNINEDDFSSADDLFSQALMLMTSGEVDKALPLFRRVEPMLRESGDKEGTAVCLGYQAIILNLQSKFDEAMKWAKEQEKIYRELGDDNGVETSREIQAQILQRKS